MILTYLNYLDEEVPRGKPLTGEALEAACQASFTPVHAFCPECNERGLTHVDKRAGITSYFLGCIMCTVW